MLNQNYSNFCRLIYERQRDSIILSWELVSIGVATKREILFSNPLCCQWSNDFLLPFFLTESVNYELNAEKVVHMKSGAK